jgi:hypothetical protein
MIAFDAVYGFRFLQRCEYRTRCCGGGGTCGGGKFTDSVRIFFGELAIG